MWIYVYGNGEFIQTILNSLNIFMGSAMGFFKVAALLSLLVFAFETTGVMPSRGYNWSHLLKTYVLLALFVLTPYTGTVVVKDVITGDAYTTTSTKMPIGLILPVSLVSTIMQKVIFAYQAKFAIDDNLNYTYSGMNFGANFILGLDRVDSYDDKFNKNLDNYMQNCGFPLLRHQGRLSELKTSNDIMSLLKSTSSIDRFVQQVDFTSGQAIIKSCQTAINDIDTYYDAHRDAILQANAIRMGVYPKVTNARFLDAANAASTTLLNVSQKAAGALKQAIAMNMIMTSIKNGAQAVGNTSLALSVYDAQQFQGYKKTSELSGAAAARTIPILVASAFAILFMLYPIMVFLAIAMGSYKAIGVFFQILVAINLIPFLYEILNYLTTYYLQQKLNTTIIGSGFNYDVSTSLYSFTDNMIIAGNYLATSAPLIAYAIVSGSAMALTSVFGHINDPAKQQSNQIGNKYAEGNENIGNVNLDSFNNQNSQQHKFDNQLSTNTGPMSLNTSNPFGKNTNIGGENYDTNFKSDLLVSPQLSSMAQHSLQNSLTHNQQELNQLSKQWGNEAQRVHDLSNGFDNRNQSGSSIGTEDYQSLQRMQQLSTNITADIGGSKLVSLNGSINSQVQDYLSHNLSEYNRLSNDLSHSSNSSIADAFKNSNSLVSSTQHQVAETISNAQTLSDLKSTSSIVSGNLSNNFDKYLRDSGYDPTQISLQQQLQLAEQFVNSSANSVNGIKNILNNPVAHMSSVSGTQPNGDGLNKPETDGVFINQLNNQQNNFNARFDDFKENPGNKIGEQMLEQGKTVVKSAKNIVDPYINEFRKITE